MKALKPPAIPSRCKSKAKCRLHYGCQTTTLIGWRPIYDGHGNCLNQDPNVRVQAVSCDTCKGEWIETRQGGSVKWDLIPSA